jgi:hypothetical protein
MYVRRTYVQYIHVYVHITKCTWKLHIGILEILKQSIKIISKPLIASDWNFTSSPPAGQDK